jgi:hypothetical protein
LPPEAFSENLMFKFLGIPSKGKGQRAVFRGLETDLHDAPSVNEQGVDFAETDERPKGIRLETRVVDEQGRDCSSSACRGYDGPSLYIVEICDCSSPRGSPLGNACPATSCEVLKCCDTMFVQERHDLN